MCYRANISVIRTNIRETGDNTSLIVLRLYFSDSQNIDNDAKYCTNYLDVLCSYQTGKFSFLCREGERERKRDPVFESGFVRVNSGGPIHLVLLDSL